MKWILIIVTIGLSYQGNSPGTNYPTITSLTFESKESCVAAIKQTRTMLAEVELKFQTNVLSLNDRTLMNCVPNK